MTQWYGPGADYNGSQNGTWVQDSAGNWTLIPQAGSSLEGHTIWYGPNATTPTGPNPYPSTQPAPAPDPFQGWNSANAGSRSYRYFTPDLQQYYEQHPDEAFRQYGSAEFGDRQTPLSDYAKGRYSDYWAQYIKASEGNDQLHWTDYLSNDLAGQIKNSFALQSPTQKGYTLQYNPGGRITW